MARQNAQGNSLLAPAHPALGEGDTLHVMAAVETETVVLM